MSATQVPSEPLQLTADLTLRLQRAEKELKGLRYVIPALAAIILVQLLAAHFDRPTTVTAEKYGLRNAKGDIVSLWSVDREGFPSMALLDADKKIRLMVSVSASGPSVSLMDAAQVTRAMLSLNPSSDPSLTFSNADKRSRSVLAIDTKGSGHLVLYGTGGGLDLAAYDGRVRWNPSDGAPVDVLPVRK
jgi:hypothetical protein